MRQRIDIVELKEIGPGGYQFNVCGADCRLRYDDGVWRLDCEGDSSLFESFAEAMNHALDGLRAL